MAAQVGEVTQMKKGSAVVFQGVTKLFLGEDGTKSGVRDLSFSVDEGEMVAIVGKTGCGKSTTLNLILGLLGPSNGRVGVYGHDPYHDFDALRGKISVVFQGDRLLPWRTAVDNVCLGLEILGRPVQERRRRAEEWLGRLGLQGYEKAYPHQLSGGMRQRVAIARAFAADPELILADEAFSALDELTANKLRSEFRNLVRSNKKTAIFVTHSIHEAITMAERILVFGVPGQVLREFSVIADLTEEDASKLKHAIIESMHQL